MGFAKLPSPVYSLRLVGTVNLVLRIQTMPWDKHRQMCGWLSTERVTVSQDEANGWISINLFQAEASST